MNPEQMPPNPDLKAFVDGELDAELSAKVARELEVHPDQHQQVLYLKEITRMLKTDLERPEPQGKEKTLKALESKTGGTRFFVKFGRNTNGVVWLSVAAVLVLVFISTKTIHLPGGSGFAADSAASTPAFSEAKADMAKAPLPSMKSAGGSIAGAKDVPIDGSSRSFGSNSFQGANTADRDENGTAFTSRSRTGTGAVGLGANRRIARAADLTVGVTDVAEASNRAVSKIDSVEGSVERDDVQIPSPDAVENRPYPDNSVQPRGVANIEADVPSERLDEVVRGLSSLGKLRAKSVRNSDVTDRSQDLAKELKAVQNRFDADSARIKNTTSVKDVRRLEELRSMAREQLRDLTSQKKELDSMVVMSHISLTLTQESGEGAGDTWHVATKGLGDFGNVILQFLIFALVWTPVWLPIGLVANYFAKRSSPRA